MNRDWIDTEEKNILKDMKNKRYPQDTKTLIFFILVLIPLAFFSFFPKAFAEIPSAHCSYDEGVFWTCKRCRTSQWSNQRDWMGNYYCSHCGIRKGDE